MDSKTPAIKASKMPTAFCNEIFSFKIKILSKTVITGYKAVKDVTILDLYFSNAKYHRIVPANPSKVANMMKIIPLLNSNLFGNV